MAAAGPLARDTTAVFVYGTLKRGSFNHHILRRCLENAGPTHQAVYTAASAASGSAQGRNHLGTAFETVQRYPLVLKPARHVPALIPQPGAGHHVTGEVYYCDAEALELLDELEEVATLKYTRQAVVVRPQAPQAASAELECQAYFISEEEAERSGLPPASKWASLGPAECLRSYIDPRYVFRSGRAERTSQRSASGISAPRCVVFCDFDGTISVTDTLDVLIDAAMGEEARERIDQQYADGGISFREMLRREITPLTETFNQGCADIAAACRKLQADAGHPTLGLGVVDPTFCAFTRMCHDAGVPVVILSGGMTQLVQRFVDDAFRADAATQALPSPEMLRRGQGLPAGTIPVRANSLVIDGDEVPLGLDSGSEHFKETRRGQWSVEFFDDSDSGNDKAAALSAWKSTGAKLIFAGDGVSDLPIATSGGGADVIFAKKGRTLERVCQEKGLAHRPFRSFAEVHDQVKVLLEGWRRQEKESLLGDAKL